MYRILTVLTSGILLLSLAACDNPRRGISEPQATLRASKLPIPVHLSPKEKRANTALAANQASPVAQSASVQAIPVAATGLAATKPALMAAPNAQAVSELAALLKKLEAMQNVDQNAPAAMLISNDLFDTSG